MSKTIPAWAKRDLVLPPWAKIRESVTSETGKVSVVIEMDPAGFVPEWLKLIGAPENREALTQYHVECAFQCAKMDVQSALQGTEFQPSLAGKPVELRVMNRPEWALKQFRKGAGVQAATPGARIVVSGQEPDAVHGYSTARGHYARVRGSVPTL